MRLLHGTMSKPKWLSGVEVPKMNWDGENLRENWRRFKQHAQFMFTGPLKSGPESIFASGVAKKGEIFSIHEKRNNRRRQGKVENVLR